MKLGSAPRLECYKGDLKLIIEHPLLGPRDSQEFTYLGDAKLLDRPDWQGEHSAREFYEYVYLRDNPAGLHRELWYHNYGDQSWLVVSRDTVTHEITHVELVCDFISRRGAKK